MRLGISFASRLASSSRLWPATVPAIESGDVMILLDASSSMLNQGQEAAPYGDSRWDQARFALAGDPLGENLSLFEQEILDEQQQVVGALEDFVHLGLAVFGNEAPEAEERVLVQYGACRQDNFYWALSPEVSHPSCPEVDYTPLLNNPATPMREIIGASPCGQSAGRRSAMTPRRQAITIPTI